MSVFPSRRRTGRALPRPAYLLLARTGYAARGAVYLIIGLFALAAAIGARTRPAGSTDVFVALISPPLGVLLLGLLALGLVCFAGWRMLQALADVDGHGRDAKGLLRRAVYGGNAVFYLALAAWAVAIAVGWTRGGGERDVHHWTAWLMNMPFGRVLVALVGLGIAAAGIAIGVRGFRPHVAQELTLTPPRERIAEPLFRFGEFGRAFAFLLIGLFVLIAAIEHRAAEAKGLAGALQALQQQPYGWAALGATALGFVAFGIFQLVEAAFRRVDGAQ